MLRFLELITRIDLVHLTFGLLSTRGFVNVSSCSRHLQLNSVRVLEKVGSVTMAITFLFSHKHKWTDGSEDAEGGMSASPRSTLKLRATQMDGGLQG